MNTQLQNMVQKVLGSHIGFGKRHPYRIPYGSYMGVYIACYQGGNLWQIILMMIIYCTFVIKHLGELTSS